MKIERIENILLYEKYIQECQRTFRKAYVTQLCTPLQNVKKSSGPGLTVKYLDQEMTKHLHEEINELYLFHGTKVNAVDVIIQQGLDSRLASSGLLGTGVYTAETASKSAGYTGIKFGDLRLRHLFFLPNILSQFSEITIEYLSKVSWAYYYSCFIYFICS